MHPLGRNFSSRRITVSTVGHIPGLTRLAREPFQVNLAVSLNGTTDKSRQELMPAARKWKLDPLFETLKAFPLERRRRITFEYVLIHKVNDTADDARRLAGLLQGLPSKVNLIRLNPFDGCSYRPSTMERVERFQQILRDRNLTTMLRKSRGAEIQAGCGQLAGTVRPATAP
jgi:23S rRNA (adenine2503-C2)-methyltransferase